ncbi:MAG TPA: hypothetical protein DCP75_04450 [Haliea salexigens]|uniref:Uncharacterized protein n=1 Tax=Haliea salexigens TaxID=287487 RepID=A0A3C1KKS4_9GAMM|nr:hypothetical protein [Haliea salexigens]MAA87738.1 hypothetical protein [Haliea sp.]HAN26964.1 hypothetical protein [Haliea salexigens]|tara:strand:- start:3800 stop:4018 length:219 start_codon:yes stop_codon:yes gene_type:complete
MARSRRRYLRTLILGLLAMAALVWGAVDSFDIPPERIWDMFLMTLTVVGLLVLAAALAAALWIGLRRLSTRD